MGRVGCTVDAHSCARQLLRWRRQQLQGCPTSPRRLGCGEGGYLRGGREVVQACGWWMQCHMSQLMGMHCWGMRLGVADRHSTQLR
jgi:hypothetical protein